MKFIKPKIVLMETKIVPKKLQMNKWVPEYGKETPKT